MTQPVQLRSPFAAETWRALQIDPPPRQQAMAPGLFGNLSGALLDFAPAAAGETFRVANRALQDISEARLRADQQQADDFTAEQILRRRVELEAEAQQRDEAGRDFVRRFTPDPAITGAGAQIVYGFGKVLTKAVPAMMAAGPVGGAVIAGSLEGGTESLRLQDEGVDRATADRVGVATALATSFGFALPVAGSTWAATAGLAAAGGPAAFMSQQQAARMILDRADYSAVAQQYDPFDPVGLAVTTGASFLFGAGAMAMRGKAGRTTPPEAPRQAEPPPSHQAVTAEQEAAARAVLLSEQAASTGLHAADDLAGAARHTEALATAARQLDEARPVDVAGIVEVDPEVSARRVRELDYSEAERIAYAETTPETAAAAADAGRVGEPARAAAEPEVVHRTVAGGDAEPGWLEATRIRRADGEPITVYRGASRELSGEDFRPEALGFATRQPSSGLGVWFAMNQGEASRYGRVEGFQLDIRNPKVVKVEDLPGFASTAEAIRYRDALQAQGFDGMLISAKHLGGQVNLVAFTPEQVIRPRAARGADQIKRMVDAIDALGDPRQAGMFEAPTGGVREVADQVASTMRQESEAARTAQGGLELQAARQAVDADPTLRVRMDEAGEPVTARQALDDAAKQADEIRQEADAFRAAVDCAMRN